MLDRDESALHAVQLSHRRPGAARLATTSCSPTSATPSSSREVFDERRPEVVFHAAALKHLPLLEQYPGEAVKTNVWGTAQRARGCRDVTASSASSTSPPTRRPTRRSVLGYSKRLAERLTAAIASEADGTYLSVRFGNVLGSRGSVLTAFAAQIAAGGPVTVTAPATSPATS